MFYTKTNADWFKEHAVDGKCKETDAKIKQWIRQHSIHDHPKGELAGGGSVIDVAYLFCPACQPNYIPPTMGSPIDEAELVEGY